MGGRRGLVNTAEELGLPEWWTLSGGMRECIGERQELKKKRNVQSFMVQFWTRSFHLGDASREFFPCMLWGGWEEVFIGEARCV